MEEEVRSDPLGSRMKEQYEHRARYFLPRRTWTLIRIDGRAFHSYTRGLERPFDYQLMEDLCETARYLCENISGTALAYAQSDEISLLVTDFANIDTQAWFNNNVAKVVSLSASLATAKFNQLRPTGGLATFDSRAFTIPDIVEVANYFVWRQQDAMRNAVAMAAQAKFSPNQLHRRSKVEMVQMLVNVHGIAFEDYPARFRLGTLLVRQEQTVQVPWVDQRDHSDRILTVHSHCWNPVAPPVFTEQPEYLAELIPRFPTVYEPARREVENV